MRARSLLAACAAAVTLLATGASTARADNVVVDGDILTNGTQSSLALGSIACNTPVKTTQTLWINRNGNYDKSNAFLAGSNVQVSATVSGTNRSSLTVTALDPAIAVPTDWAAADNNTVTSDKASFQLTVSSPTAGTAQSATVTFTATGRDADNTSLTRSVNLPVSCSTQSCSTNTPPEVSVTGVADGASYTFGEVPAAGCTVTDAEDPNPSASPTLTPNDNNVGLHTVTCSYTDGGSLKAEASATYTVTPATPTIALTCNDATYDGKAHECSAVVKGVGGTPISGASATITYDPNATDAGTVTATATYSGAGNYAPAEAVVKTFVIGQADSAITDSADTVTYTGSALEPCTATVNGVGGVLGTATLVYSDNINAGTGSVIATYAGDQNHKGGTEHGSFTIDKAISSVTVTCGDATFTGDALTPCTATVHGAGVVTGDATLVYSNNVHAGTGNVTATYGGDDNHYGSSKDASFTIGKATSTVNLTCTPGPFTYNGTPQTPCTATVTGAGGLDLPLEVDYAGTNVNAGTAHAYAGYEGDDDHLGDTADTTFTIDKAASVVTVSCANGSYYFTGDPITPSCTARATGAGGLDVAVAPVTFTNNVAVGTATASATWAGDDNHLGSTGSTTFSILKWTTGGFFQPVDMGGVVNTVKAGSTVPLKFTLSAGAKALTSVSDVASFKTQVVSCKTLSGSADPLDVTTTGGTTLRYDTTAAQFIQNWQTPKGAGICYVATMTARDGSTITANFMTK